MINRPSSSPQSADTSGETVDRFTLVYERLKAFLPVDLVEIDRDLAQMPVIAQEAAELAAEMMNKVATAKQELDIARAQAAQQLRNMLVAGKPRSEARIETEMPLDRGVQMRQREVDALEYRFQIAKDLARNMQKKSDQITNATNMIMKGWMTPNSVYERQLRDRKEARSSIARG
jgi:predicted RNase H-like nuclease (RuvC/YqgF family)